MEELIETMDIEVVDWEIVLYFDVRDVEEPEAVERLLDNFEGAEVLVSKEATTGQVILCPSAARRQSGDILVSVLERLRERVELVELAGRYTDPVRSSSSLKCRCPYPDHEDKNPTKPLRDSCCHPIYSEFNLGRP
jgi:hypothetical protein